MEFDSVNQTEQEIQEPLIRGLPDEIALDCLARVPQEYHSALRCVSRRLRDLVHNGEWQAYRREQNLVQTLIYAICRDRFEKMHCYVLDPDSSTRCWKRLQGIPCSVFGRNGMCVQVTKKKLYRTGGHSRYGYVTEKTFCYDVSKTTLATDRSHFVCQVLDGKIQAIGLDGQSKEIRLSNSWENGWEFYTDPNSGSQRDDSFVFDGKIYIRQGIHRNVCAIVYEPSSGAWQLCDSDILSGWRGPAVVVDGTLYVLDQAFEPRMLRLTMWRKDIRNWVVIGKLPDTDIRPPYKLVAVGKRIYVVGMGLSTLIFDVNTLGLTGEVKATAYLPELTGNYEHILCCKSLTI